MAPRAFGCLALAAALLGTGSASARRDGIEAPDCSGCHGSFGADIQVSASPSPFEPNDAVTFTVTIRRTEGAASVGGVFVSKPASGELRALSGEGLLLEPASGLLHTQPKTAQGGSVTFRFAWHAPGEPGGMSLDVAALAANGDGRQTGDQAGAARFVAAFGCTGVTHYADLDGDGYGTELFESSIGCEGAPVPAGHALDAGDCNDNDSGIHPSATERCNRKDDDCDGEIDEDSLPVELWPDEDGDGYYGARSGTPMMGCVGISGYAAEGGDCAPDDPEANPGALESCNGIDDNCDGRVDERVRPQCGEGRCRRESNTCNAADCRPGVPSAELCNYLDDDCNGVIDDDAPCPDGNPCVRGKCTALDAGAPAGTGGSSTSGGGSTTGGTAVGGNSTPGGASGASRPNAGEPTTAIGCAVAKGRAAGSELTPSPMVLGVLLVLSARRRRRKQQNVGAGLAQNSAF